MPDAQSTIDQGAANRAELIALINQFFSDPSRMQEASQLVNAQTDQAYNAATGQYDDLSRQIGFNAASRGLQGSSIAGSQQGQARRGLTQQLSSIEAQRQSQLANAQLGLEALRQQSLAQVYNQPLQDQTFSALNAALSGQLANTQQQGVYQQQNQALQAQNSQNLAQSVAQPLNLISLLTQLNTQAQQGR